MGARGDNREICPFCYLPGTPIMYGYPSGEGAERIHLGQVAGGGCVIHHDAPTMRCPRRHEWRPARPHQLPASTEGVAAEVVAAARHYVAGDVDDAVRGYRAAARTAAETLGDGHPEALVLRHALATALYRAGSLAEGEQEYRAMHAAAGRPLRGHAVPTLDELREIIDRRHGSRDSTVDDLENPER